MDETEGDSRYPQNSYGVNNKHGYGPSQSPKLPVRNAIYPQPTQNHHAEEEEDEDDGLGEEEDEENVLIGDDANDEDEDYNSNGEQVHEGNYSRNAEDAINGRNLKKRKLKNLISSYEFAPRVPTPSAAATAAASFVRPAVIGRNSLTDWTEHETFILLDAWGHRFLQLGRKSLRSEEWQEVAERVSQESKIERNDTQCRNRLDTLKKTYKKEKTRLARSQGGTSKWVYFKKMAMLMSSPPHQSGLSCGMDSGEYVFMNPRVYLNQANGFDEMRDSPGNSESCRGEKDDSDELPPKKTQDGSSFRLLADAIRKFSEIYEKIESSKRKQMMELEKMRIDFQRELEAQRTQILERAQAEIEKIRRGEIEIEDDVSAENNVGGQH
ncbi:hypothetical protein Nepgr_017800 [Nepenthes gracilis]|uniref:Myb-like domain-containing protein n=1 Tax=Nepenthes gracilis TaxID=150966 RepID=A0AAD3XTG3_NEPGR|nr:hypothetical protein Nepgr_017800 [Nepenthes gracilis]